jgi:hypothetical protein
LLNKRKWTIPDGIHARQDKKSVLALIASLRCQLLAIISVSQVIIVIPAKAGIQRLTNMRYVYMEGLYD